MDGPSLQVRVSVPALPCCAQERLTDSQMPCNARNPLQTPAKRRGLPTAISSRTSKKNQKDTTVIATGLKLCKLCQMFNVVPCMNHHRHRPLWALKQPMSGLLHWHLCAAPLESKTFIDSTTCLLLCRAIATTRLVPGASCQRLSTRLELPARAAGR